MTTIRPESLSDAVARGGENLWVQLDEFLDEFYLAYPDKEAMSGMIAHEPELLGDGFLDAYVAAVAEHLAVRWDLEVPSWVDGEGRLGSASPSFVPDIRSLRPILLVESPYAFRRRNIFVGEEPLQRARWPRDVPVYEPVGPSPRP